MRLTGVIWTCPNCQQEYELFSDDNGLDRTICWNWCPYCKKRNDVWLRFKYPYEIIKSGISYEDATKIEEQKLKELEK
jgi:hypothetical protein